MGKSRKRLSWGEGGGGFLGRTGSWGPRQHRPRERPAGPITLLGTGDRGSGGRGLLLPGPRRCRRGDSVRLGLCEGAGVTSREGPQAEVRGRGSGSRVTGRGHSAGGRVADLPDLGSPEPRARPRGFAVSSRHRHGPRRTHGDLGAQTRRHLPGASASGARRAARGSRHPSPSRDGWGCRCGVRRRARPPLPSGLGCRIPLLPTEAGVL